MNQPPSPFLFFPEPEPGHLPLFTVPQPNGETGALEGGVYQLDLTGLQDDLVPQLADPDAPFVGTEVIPRPDAAAQTAGPHRYTIYVPHDDGAMINVGASRAPFSPGIGMATKSNITLRTYELAPTALSLGAPPAQIGPLNQTAGYSLYTEGFSNHISKLQLTMASQEEGASITASQAVSLTSQHDSVTLAGASTVSATAKKIAISAKTAPAIDASGWDKFVAGALVVVGAADVAAPLAGVKGNAGAAISSGSATANFLGPIVSEHAEKLKAAWMASVSEGGTKILTHLTAVVSLYLSYKKSFKSPQKGKTGFEVKASKFKTLLAAAKEIKALIDEIPKDPKPNNTGVTIDSDAAVTVSAAGKVTIGGHGGAGISGGFGGASVSGLSASLAGQKDASISGGLGVTVKSLAGDVELASDLKGASMKAKKDIELVSEAGKVAATGKEDVQLNSTEAKAFVHGKAGAYLGAGSGDGYGVVAKPDKLELGCVAPAETFGDAAAKPDKAMAKFDANGATIQYTNDTKLVANDRGAGITSNKLVAIRSTGGNIVLKGNVIELN